MSWRSSFSFTGRFASRALRHQSRAACVDREPLPFAPRGESRLVVRGCDGERAIAEEDPKWRSRGVDGFRCRAARSRVARLTGALRAEASGLFAHTLVGGVGSRVARRMLTPVRRKATGFDDRCVIPKSATSSASDWLMPSSAHLEA